MAIKSQKNQKIMVVMISILLSFFLWLYVMGEKNPIQTKAIADVPVTLTNVESITQSNLILVPNQSFNMDLNITGRAFDISKITMSDIKVEADMSGSLKKGSNNIPVKFITSQKGITITNKNGLPYINVKMDELIEKMVPVIVNIRGNVKDGYGYTKPLVRPSIVKVSGPADYVKTALSALGEIKISGNYTNTSGSIPVIPQDKNGDPVSHINVTPKYVDATVSIKPSKEVPVKINTYGIIGNGKILMNIKSQVDRVVIIGDQKYLNKINEINTTALDLSKIVNSTTTQLALNIPMGVNVIDGVNSINVVLTVENKVEKVFNLPITIINESSDYSYTMPQQVVSVRMDGPESIMNTLNDKSIDAIIDVGGLSEGSYTIPITTSQIDGVEIKTITPASANIEVISK